MIKKLYSRRHKQVVYRLDATLNGRRFRRFFLKKSEAEAVAYKIKHDETARRYGLPIMQDRPMLDELIDRRLGSITNKSEQARSRRVLVGLLILQPPGTCVDEMTKAAIQKYVEKRLKDKLKPQSVDRELNIIAAMFNSVDLYYSQLEQWRPPRMPRPKIIGGRRERLWAAWEIKSILHELQKPRTESEQEQAAIARFRVGQKVRFCLLNGLRHSEMNRLPKGGINWQTREVTIYQGKTGNKKVIGPLGETSMAILKEFYDQSETTLVFSRSGNITPKFYRILRSACQRAGVLYGKNVDGGLILHDARHTATTHLLEDNVSPATVREWMGWSQSYFVSYYGHATKKSREKAGRSLERLAGKKSA